MDKLLLLALLAVIATAGLIGFDFLNTIIATLPR